MNKILIRLIVGSLLIAFLLGSGITLLIFKLL